MSRRAPPGSVRHRSVSRFGLRPRIRRLAFERLEDRTMLDGAAGSSPPSIVVGRTLSSYFVGRRPEQPGDDHLHGLQRAGRPRDRGVADDHAGAGRDVRQLVRDARRHHNTQLPDQNGQNLAWSLGTIQGYDRASVAVTVALANPIPMQLDSGARRSPRSTPAPSRPPRPPRRLQPGNAPTDASGNSLLDSTPDANTTDPFIQEEAAAARLRPDPDLQLPAHPDRLQLVPRLGAGCAGHALVERRQCARRRQPGRGLDARLGHPGAVRRRGRCRRARRSS